LIAELVALAHGLDDPWLSGLAAFRGCSVGIEAGDRSLTESCLDVLRALSASVPQPHIRRIWLIFESVLAFVRGDLQAAEQWGMQALEIGTAAGEPDAFILFGGHLSALRTFQGRLGELAEQTAQLAGESDSVSGWRAGAALALLEVGRSDDARELVLAEDLRSIPWDQAWSAALFWWAVVCSRLRLRAREVYELVAPFAGEFAAPPGMVYGTFDWALGALAASLERYKQAEAHFAAAAEIEERLGAPLFLAHTHASWARALIDRGWPEDLDRALPMLEQAEETAERLGAGLVTREARECRAALAATSR